MNREEQIREAERKVIEAARAVRSLWEWGSLSGPERNLVRKVDLLNHLQQPPTALDVIERVREAVNVSWECNSDGYGVRAGILVLLKDLEREVRGEVG